MALKAVLSEIRAPDMIGAGHVAEDKTLQAQAGVGFLPGLAERL